jgi:hypothetical protein
MYYKITKLSLIKQKVKFCAFTLTRSKPRPKVYVSVTVTALHWPFFDRGVRQKFSFFYSPWLSIWPFCDSLESFSHSLGFTALLLLDIMVLILVIYSASFLIGLDGRWGYLSSLTGSALSLHHIRYLQLRIIETFYSFLIFWTFCFQIVFSMNRRKTNRRKPRATWTLWADSRVS